MTTELFITTPRAGTVSITDASATITGSGTAFTAGDVGKQIVIRTTAGDKRRTISAYTSATSIDVSVALDFTQSGCFFYVDYYSMDLAEDFPYSLNYSIADVRHPESRNSSFSKTIKIPGTKANNIIFDHIFEITAQGSFNPNIRAFAIVYSNFIPVFNGNLQLLRINRDGDKIEYECTVFGKNGDLFQKIGDKLLTDLDLSAFDEYGTNAQIQASWATPAELFYPLLNNGRQAFQVATPAFSSRTIAPAIRVSTILENILTSVGYTIADSATLYGDTMMDRLYVPCTKQQRRRVFIDFGLRGNYTTGGTGNTGDIFLNIDRIKSGNTESTFTGNAVTDSVGNYAYQTTIEADYGDVIYFTIVPDIANSPDSFTEVDHANTFLNITYLDNQFSYNTNGNNELDLSGNVVLAGAGTATVNIKYNNEIVDDNNTWDGVDEHTVPVKHTQGFLPDNYKQRDFLLTLIKMFNLYLEPVFDTPETINILPRDTYYSQGGIVDWTTKLDVGQNIQITPMAELDWREYLFTWKPDNDYYNKTYTAEYNQTYGQRIVTVDNDFIQNKNTISVECSPTPLTGASAHTMVLPGIITNGVDTATNFYAGNMRMVYFDGTMATEGFTLDGGAIADYPFCGHLKGSPQGPDFDFNFAAPQELFYTFTDPASYPFSANLYTLFWQNFIREISDRYSKLITAQFNLTAEDIRTIDFRDQYFVDGVYYRLNKIINYSPVGNQLTTVELIMIPDAVNVSSQVNDNDTEVAVASDNPLPLVSSELASGEIIVGNADGIATAVPMTGDSTIDNTGRVIGVAIQGNAVKNAAPSNGNVLTWVTANSRWEPVAPSGGGGTPGGADKNIQYNDGGAFGGEAGFEYDKATNKMTAPDIIVSNLTATRIVTTDGSKQLETANTKTTDGTLAGNSDTNIPTEKAVKTYADSKVVDAINNGATTTAPSENAVFDALALKQRSMVLDKLTTGGGSGTATTETKVYSYAIPANTFASGDFIQFMEKFTKSATNGNVTIRVRWSTTDAVAGTVIATYTGTSATRVIALQRLSGIFSSATNLNIYSGTTSVNIDVNFDSATSTNVTVDLTITNYLVVTYQNGSASDTTAHVLSLTERK